MSFPDHFSGHANIYAAARPSYPDELFQLLGEACSGKSLAIDCAAGNGQAAIPLCNYFDTVIASDASFQQLEELPIQQLPSGRLTRVVSVAESIPLPDQCADLLTVAQAMHWFHYEKFRGEVDRLLKPGGVFAVWSYGIHSISAEVDRVISYLYEDITGEFWTPERRIVESGYAEYDFPYREVSTPDFKLSKSWSIEQVLAYLNSWSAVQRYQEHHGSNPLELIHEELQASWGEVTKRDIVWPLTFKVRKKQ